MATVTYTCTKDASAWYNNDAWSGWDNHHPVGTNSNGNRWASFLYFPINFSGMTGITSATLKLYQAEVAFVTHTDGNSSTTMQIRRMTSDWGEGTNRGENIWSVNEVWDWSNRVNAGNTTTGQVSVTATTPVNNTLVTFDITSIVQGWAPASAGGSNYSNYGILLYNTSTSSTQGVEYYSRHTSGKEPQLTIVYSTNTAPNAPTSLNPTGGYVTGSLTPTFTGTFSDPDAGDTMSGYQILLYSDAGGTTLVWDSGTVATTAATNFSKVYSGPGLTGNTLYYWKARTRDTNGSAWGPYSALQSFKANTPPPTPSGLSPTSGQTVTNLTPVFSGNSDDPDPSDQLATKQVIVYTDAGGSTVKWDSGEVAASGTTFSLTYAGTALSSGTTYYWKCRVKDTNGAYSAYTGLSSFTTYTVGTPTGLSPASAKVNTLTPTFTATAAVTQNAYEIIVYASDQSTVVDDTGTVAATGTAISRLYSGAALSWGTKYYWKVRSRDTGNVWSAYTANQPFWTNASPSAIQTSPANNAVVTTLTPAFTAGYSDPDKSNGFSDDPTNYTVEVSRVSDSVVMHTLAKTTSLSGTSNSVTRAAEGTALSNDVQYRWRARYTDSSGAANALGSYTGYFLFKPSQIPTISSFVCQAADLTTGAINKPTPTFTWTFGGSGGKTQQTKQFSILDSNNVLLYDTGALTNATASYTVPVGYLSNGNSYTFTLVVTDTDGLSSTTASVGYTATWTPPAAITNLSATGDDVHGYIQLDWDASSLSTTDFNRYAVYRSTDGGNSWTNVENITDESTSSYIDYGAAVGVAYTYKVRQWKNIAGDQPLESADSEIVTTSIPADDWFIVVPNRDDLSMLLYVSDENHSEPFAQEVFEPFGRNRKVIVRSGIMGREGNVAFYVLSENRSDRMTRLETLLALNTPVYLKNPFGDVHYVFFDAPQISYLTGGNVKVSMNYTEVDS